MGNYRVQGFASLHKLAIVAFFVSMLLMPSLASLEVGYYRSTCPMAEKIVRRTVVKAVAGDHGLAAGLIRLYFHDCFVRGCDASVLLDPLPNNPSEKLSPVNNGSLRGYEVIDDAKAELEAYCPETVSCADIIAFAARDSTFITGGFDYSVPSGRRDGVVSIDSEVVQNLPFPTFNAKQLIRNFARKGLSAKDMVTLSGAHSIGVSHCSSFDSRLYRFNATHPQDPSLNHHLATFLKARCLPPSKTVRTQPAPTVPLDIKAPNHLDVKYYKNLLKGKGLLTSDQTLASSRSTLRLVIDHARNPSKWNEEFAAAMVRMGNVDVLAGNEGEIRKNCRVVND
ncbi:peroxidase 5-like [Phoenix dactylifera]|uniref:Peroxidase n=1 Tax=Phoenix dactylifera TaxID=42345 RepID=A0A8B7BGI5_PHODC|nr:peroxidase 5-like [Phoenix dactylifera]